MTREAIIHTLDILSRRKHNLMRFFFNLKIELTVLEKNCHLSLYCTKLTTERYSYWATVGLFEVLKCNRNFSWPTVPFRIAAIFKMPLYYIS